jgi:hypothetical protein
LRQFIEPIYATPVSELRKVPLKDVEGCFFVVGSYEFIFPTEENLKMNNQPLSLFPALHVATRRTTHTGLTPAATNTSAGAINPVGVAKVLSFSATSAQAATLTASGLSLTTAR